jgi:hypothetical protein
MSARKLRDVRPQAASTDVFVDPLTGEKLDPEECRCDAHGVDLVGHDDADGMWWGTDRAAWRLEVSSTLVDVSGFTPSGLRFRGFFIGSEEAAIRFVSRWGKAAHIESSDIGKSS